MNRSQKINAVSSCFPRPAYPLLLFTCAAVGLSVWEVSKGWEPLSPPNSWEWDPPAQTRLAEPPANPERLNLNQATLQQLQSLPGIGPITAQRIVDYRHKNPAFRQVDELLIIRGISRKRLELIRDRISAN